MTRIDYSKCRSTTKEQRIASWQSKNSHIKAWHCAKATTKQKNYIRGLYKDARIACDNETLAIMSVREAGLMIEELKRLTNPS